MTTLHTLTTRYYDHTLTARLEVEFEAHPDPDGCTVDLLGVYFVDVTCDRPNTWADQTTLQAAVTAELLNQPALRKGIIAACRAEAEERDGELRAERMGG